MNETDETINNSLPKVGDYVTTDTIIGHLGNTGLFHTSYTGKYAGTHLHLNLKLNGQDIDPSQNWGDAPNVDCYIDTSGNDPYDGLHAENLGNIELEFTKKGNKIEFTKSKIPAPKLTSVTTENNQDYTIHGVAIKKNQPAIAKIYEETCSFVFFCETKLKETKDITIQHTEVKAFKDTWLGDKDLNQHWNDSELGRFSFTKNVPKDLHDDQEVYAKSYIYGNFDCLGLTCDYGNGFNESGQSNRVLPVEDAEKNILKQITHKYDKNLDIHIMTIPYQNENVCVKSHIGLKDDYQNYSGDNRFQAKDFKTLSTEQSAKYKGMLPVAGINADLYDKNPDKPLGVNIEEGTKYHSSVMNPNWWAFVIDDQENISFKTNQELKDISDTSNLNSAAGFFYFIENGQYRKPDSNPEPSKTWSSLAVVEVDGQEIIVTITRVKTGIAVYKLATDKISIEDLKSTYESYGKVKHAILFDGGASPSIYYNKNNKEVYQNTVYDIISGVYFYEGEGCKN